MHYHLKELNSIRQKCFERNPFRGRGQFLPTPSVWRERKSNKINSQINKMQCFKRLYPFKRVWAAPEPICRQKHFFPSSNLLEQLRWHADQ
ncbi:hypothetical protein CDAR_407891 [Caerostris darwini]|uniref:Uncharacterized protein n=1 Tax=Caerostris darwini TaxID=1538125 RepID=A0AAV4RUP2_9ARAC|nr:hypothetical protein CDAR_407891 [Caerostris darwini]